MGLAAMVLATVAGLTRRAEVGRILASVLFFGVGRSTASLKGGLPCSAKGLA